MKYIIALMMICINNFSYAFSYTQEFTEVELQEKISAMMPLEKKKYFITIIITDPVIDLHEASNELSIKANIAAQAPGNMKGSGTTHISGSISYNPETATFHLQNPTIIDLHIQNVPENHQPKIKQVAQLAISNALAKYPLYKLQDDNLKHQLAKSVLESVTVQDEKLLVKLSVL